MLAYFQWVHPGQLILPHIPSTYVDAGGRKPDYAKPTTRPQCAEAAFTDYGGLQGLALGYAAELNSNAIGRSDNSGTGTYHLDSGNSHGTDMDSRSRGAHQC